jgi:hypothetical protein
MLGARSKIRDWIERWTERLYWQGYLVLTILGVLVYVSSSFALTRQINPFIALFLTLTFPLSLLGYHARRSPGVGRLGYLVMGGSVGGLAGFLLLFLIVTLFRTVTGMTIPAVSVIPALALGTIGGAMMADRIGRRRGYFFPLWT